MSNEPTNIDALLSAASAGNIPSTSENSVISESEAPSGGNEVAQIESAVASDETYGADASDDAQISHETTETDDYGNDRAPSKTFTEEEVNERINLAMRERMARMEKLNQSNPQNNGQQQPQQHVTGEGDGEWQKQLESFVEQTVTNMSQKQLQQAQMQREQQVQAEFEAKFRSGMERHKDFHQVVGQQPITDAMTMASRSMKDPAAFFYAASKRAPQELQRIAQMPDHYAQMVEIGKLEERMRQSKPITKTPKPIGKMQEDSAIPSQKDRKEPTIEELIARDAAKRQAAQNRYKRS